MASVAGMKTTAHDTDFQSEAWKEQTSKIRPKKQPANVLTKKFGKKGKVRNKNYNFGTREPIGNTDTSYEAFTAAGTGLKVNDPNTWRVGEIFIPDDGGAAVEYLVDAVTTGAAGTGYVEIHDIAGTDRDIASGATLIRMGPFGEEGSQFATAAFKEGSKYTNYLGELEHSWELSDIESRTKLYVDEEELPELVELKVYEHNASIEYLFYRGIGYEGATAGANSRRLAVPDGLFSFLDTNGTSTGAVVTNWSGDVITEDLWEEFTRHMSQKAEKDGSDKFIFCGGVWQKFFHAMNKKYGTQYLTPGMTDFGFPMRTYIGNYGMNFHIIWDPVLEPNYINGGCDLACVDIAGVERVFFDGPDGVTDAREYNTTQTDYKKQTGVLYSMFTFGWSAPDFHGKWMGARSYDIS